LARVALFENRFNLFDTHPKIFTSPKKVTTLAKTIELRLQDGMGGVALTPATLAQLAEELPNFAGIKDSSGDLTQVAEMIRLCPPRFKVIMGKDTLIYGALVYGAAGAIAATANVAPKLIVGDL